MIDALDCEALRTFVDALPPEDKQVLILLAGLEGHMPCDIGGLKEALDLKKGKAHERAGRAFRRLRLAMRISAEVDDIDILEALVVGETRKRAAEMMRDSMADAERMDKAAMLQAQAGTKARYVACSVEDPGLSQKAPETSVPEAAPEPFKQLFPDEKPAEPEAVSAEEEPKARATKKGPS